MQVRLVLSMAVAFLGVTSVFTVDAADDRQGEIDAAIRRVKAGDLSVITEASQAKDFRLLYALLWMTRTNRIEPTAEARLANLARQALAGIPGHAKYLADQIDSMSDIKGTSRERQHYFTLLGRVGSPEAIQQVSRFLSDERNPEADRNLVQKDTIYYNNSVMAWHALESLVMDDLDLSPEIKDKIKNGSWAYSAQVWAATHAWWESDKSLPYRQGPNAETKPATPVEQLPSAAPHVPGTPQPPELPKPTLEAQEHSLKIWVLGALLVAVAASLAVLLVRQSRS